MAERITIIQFVEKYTRQFASNTFLWEKVGKEWTATTFGQTRKEAYRIAAGLMALGVQKGEKVSLLSEGRNLWVLGELGILYAGAVNVPLSVKLEESNDLVFRIRHSDSKYVMVSAQQLPKIRKILSDLPLVEKVIVLDDLDKYGDREMPLSEIRKMGDAFLSEHEDMFRQRYESIGPDDYANISYTSGTTADPKGILLTHRNYTANVEQAADNPASGPLLRPCRRILYDDVLRGLDRHGAGRTDSDGGTAEHPYEHTGAEAYRDAERPCPCQEFQEEHRDWSKGQGSEGGETVPFRPQHGNSLQ